MNSYIIMGCPQITVYIIYIIIQTIINTRFLGQPGFQILGPALFIGVLYVLCKNKHYMIGNILVALSIVLGLGLDLFMLTNKKAIRRLLYVQGERKVPNLGPGGQEQPHNLGPGGQEQPHNLGPGGQQQPHNLGPGGQQQPHNLGPGGQQQPHNLGPGGQEQPHNLGPGGQRR
jgi:hypothetical protein